MFDRYTEKARRVIFFSRYEASEFGSPYIETEHLLLGLLREDRALGNRLLRQADAVEQVRRKIESSSPRREKISTSVDLPLSNESKRILAYAAEEAERVGHRWIGTEHLLAGVLREERCFATELLKEHGVTLEAVRSDLKASRPDMNWTGGGGGFGRGIAGRGDQKQPMAEFVCGEKKLLSAISFAPPPRIGERVVLGKAESAKRYRVRDVTYRYDMPSENAKEAAAAVEDVAGAIRGSQLLIPASITVYLEEEEK